MWVDLQNRGLIHPIINIEKSYFEMLNTVYLENKWCLVYAILHQSIVIQDNSIDVLFNCLVAKLPTILNSFTNTTSDCIGCLVWDGGEPQSGGETHAVL